MSKKIILKNNKIIKNHKFIIQHIIANDNKIANDDKITNDDKIVHDDKIIINNKNTNTNKITNTNTNKITNTNTNKITNTNTNKITNDIKIINDKITNDDKIVHDDKIVINNKNTNTNKITNDVKIINDKKFISKKCNAFSCASNNMKISRPIYNATNITSSKLSYNDIKPPKVYIDRTFYLSVKYLITLNRTSEDETNILDSWGFNIAPRCMFVNNSFSKISLQLNNTIYNQDKNTVLVVEERVNWKESQKYLTQSCSVADQSQLYSELLYSIRNPLAGIQNSEPDQIVARGGFNGIEIISNTNTEAQFYLTGYEPIMLSPLIWQNLKKKPFENITNIAFNGIFDNNLHSRILSISDDNQNISVASVVPVSSTLSLIYYNIPRGTHIRKSLSYSFYPYNQNIFDNSIPLSSGGTTSTVINNIKILSNTIKIYVFVKQTKNYCNVYTTDTFARINNISITFMNHTSILASSSPQQLHQISLSNGVELSWDQWYGSTSGIRRNGSGVGSILCINPNIDFGYSNYDINNMKSHDISYMSIAINYTSLFPNSITDSKYYSTYVICVNKSKFSNSNI